MDSARYSLPLDSTLARLVAGLDEDAREYFEERAGILEFDGGHPRREAERLAWEETQLHLRRRIESDNAEQESRLKR
jgi:hypothetical protein